MPDVTDDETLLIRWFLRDHPEFIPEVAVGTETETEPEPESEPAKPLFTAAAWNAFQGWTHEVLDRMTLPELRKCRDYFKGVEKEA